MNEKELKEVFYRTKLFEEIESVSCYVFNLLDMSEERRVMIESLIGNALDKAFVAGVSHGMAEIINTRLWW